MICLRMGKTYTVKIPLDNSKVTTPENPLLLQQAVTNKGIAIPCINLQLNFYPNIQLDLFCSDNLSFQCTAPNMWLTNQCTDPSTWLTTNLRRMLAAKFFNSLHVENQETSWLQNPTAFVRSSFLKRKMNSSICLRFTICLWKTFALSCISYDGP